MEVIRLVHQLDLTDYLKKDGSDKMNGLLNMNNRRIENVAPGRHNTADALTHVQLEAFYFDLNVDNCKIEAQNPIEMGNKKMSGLAEPLHHKDASTKFYIDNSMVLKADKTQLNNYILKSGLTKNLDMKNHNIDNVKEATLGHQAINFTQLNNEMSNYLHETGGTMKGDIDPNGNSIYGIQNTVNKTSAVNREYVNNELQKKLDKNKAINMGGNKIVSYRKPNDLNELVNKLYVDQKVSQAGGSVNLSPYLKKDRSVVITNDLNLNNNKIINVKNASNNLDAVNLQQLNNSVSAVSLAVDQVYL